MATKDYTKQPQATTPEDVANQDFATRLWQSMEPSYDQQIKDSNKSYEQSMSATLRSALNRGGARSSYLDQTLANMNNQMIETQNQIRRNKIADFQNRLSEEEWRQKQWDYQLERDRISDEQWQKQYDAQQNQWKEEFEYNKMTQSQQIAYNYLMNMLESGDNPSDTLLQSAGISRADYEQMKATAVKPSGGGRGGNPSKQKAPWELLGVSEAEYASRYPNEYKAYTGKKTVTDDEVEKEAGSSNGTMGQMPLNQNLPQLIPELNQRRLTQNYDQLMKDFNASKPVRIAT